MAASKFEDRLDASHCNIESYFNKSNTSINASTALNNSECSAVDQSSESKDKFLKSTKSNIASYFKKKQDTIVKYCEESKINKDTNEDNKELNSFLSACNDMNNIDTYTDESCDSNLGKASTAIENAESLICDKQNESIRMLEDEEQSVCNNVDIVDINDKSNESKIVSPVKPDKPLEFFAQNLKEQSKCNFDVEFESTCENSSDNKFNYIKKFETKSAALNDQNEPKFFAKSLKGQFELNSDVRLGTSCDSLDNKFNDTEIRDASHVCGTKTVVSDSESKPLGFFATHVKEQSKLNFDVRFDASCDSSDNKFTADKTGEASHTCDSKTVASNDQTKPLGFFAKKLKEKSEFGFSIEFETSCDSLDNEPAKNNHSEYQKNSACGSGASSSVLMHEQDLSSVSNDGNEYINLDPELTKLCEQCNKRIPIWEETEHLDFHLALNLSKEFSNSHRTVLQSTRNNSSSVISKNVTQKSKTGRKRGSATKSSSQPKKPLVKTKTIDSFFKS